MGDRTGIEGWRKACSAMFARKHFETIIGVVAPAREKESISA